MLKLATCKDLLVYKNKYKKTCYELEQAHSYGLKEMGTLFCLDVILNNKPKVVLEIGPGFNCYFDKVLPEGIEYWTIDEPGFYDKSTFADAVNKRTRARHVNGLMGAFLKDLPSNYFDIIFSISVLEHTDFPKLPSVFSDIRRCLKPGGHSIHSFDLFPQSAPAQEGVLEQIIVNSGMQFEQTPEGLSWDVTSKENPVLLEPLKTVCEIYYKDLGDKFPPFYCFGTALIGSLRPHSNHAVDEDKRPNDSVTCHEVNVVLNFHRKDQQSAAALLSLLMTVPEGVTCKYYLQYGDDESSLEIKDVLTKFMQSKSAEFSNKLPDIRVPDEFIDHDPNLLSYDGNHALRSTEQKRAICQWNLCVFKYIQLLDDFLVIEPDCVILKKNWLKDIFAEYWKSDSPVFGHLKKGMIGNSLVPTHWAGCSVYNGKKLRELPLAHHFFNRYDNPWWPYRNSPGTTNANNAFYGPVFSGYDVSYDYFLFALYWREKTGSNNPADWPLGTLVDRSDLIFCDFHSALTANEIMSRYAGKLPLMHGVKHDEIRHRMRRYFAQEHPPVTTLTAGAVQGGSYEVPSGRSPTEEENLAISNQKLAAFKDRHRGQRCVIIGNGPSLNKMDLSFLEHEITFGMNRIYFLFDKWKFRPTYYASVNPLVLEQSAEEILKISAPKFLSNKGIPFFPYPPDDVMFIKSLPKWYFSRDPREGLCEGWTVTFFAMQLAYFMGFSEVILIGVDHHFATQGDPNKEVVSEGADPNHFHPDYFGKGIRWHLPDLERSEGSYKMAKAAFETEGRRIIDATVDGKLTVFPKADYRDLFFDPKTELIKKLDNMLAEYAANPTPELGFKLASRLRMANLHDEANMVIQHIQASLVKR